MNKEVMSEPTFSLSEATSEHAEEIFRIQKKTWLATYPNKDIGVTKEMIEERFGDAEGRVQKWRDKIEGGKSKIWVAKAGTEVVGFCGVIEGAHENRLASIYVDPAQQGVGIGSALIEQALHYLGRGKDILIDVVSYNESAIAFYIKHGFVVDSSLPEEELLTIGVVKLPEIKMLLKRSDVE